MKQDLSNTLGGLRVVILSFGLLASALQLPSYSQQKFVNGPTDPKELETFIGKIFTEEMDRQHIPGAEFVFVKDGKVFFSKGYGFANLEKQQRAVPEQTIFRIGSISKVFTATAVVQLADRGRLNLQTDVNRYLKKLKVPATFSEPVTPAHLITHTAGFDEIRPGTQGPTAESVLPLADFLSTRLKRIRDRKSVV